MSEYDIKYLIYIIPTVVVIIGFSLFLILKKDKKNV